MPFTSSPLRRRTVAVLLAGVVVPAALAASGCGGSDSNGNQGDAKALLNRAFDKPVKSADVKLNAELKVQGVPGFDKPIRVQASGPYITQKGTLPKLDIDLTLGAQGQGQSLQTGLLSTGTRAFLKFGGEYYEQPQANVARANKQLSSDKGSGKSRADALGIDPASWIRDAKMEDSQKVGGVDSDHVSARIDVRKVLADLNRVAEKGAGAVGGSSTPQPLAKAQLDQAAKTVKDPTFDIYVGKSDGFVHRVSGNLALAVPKADRSKANGITGGSLQFTLDLTHTNGGQTVEAPASSRPISDLSKQLGGAAALGALGGSSGTDTTPQTTTPAPSGTSTTPDSAAFKRYADCLDKAKPGDTRAISRCSTLLNR
jgi:hypothetical protein